MYTSQSVSLSLSLSLSLCREVAVTEMNTNFKGELFAGQKKVAIPLLNFTQWNICLHSTRPK